MKEEFRERRANGTVVVWCQDDGLWGVSWEPDEGHDQPPAQSFTNRDSMAPSDFPAEYDVELILAWARERFPT